MVVEGDVGGLAESEGWGEGDGDGLGCGVLFEGAGAVRAGDAIEPKERGVERDGTEVGGDGRDGDDLGGGEGPLVHVGDADVELDVANIRDDVGRVVQEIAPGGRVEGVPLLIRRFGRIVGASGAGIKGGGEDRGRDGKHAEVGEHAGVQGSSSAGLLRASEAGDGAGFGDEPEGDGAGVAHRQGNLGGEGLAGGFVDDERGIVDVRAGGPDGGGQGELGKGERGARVGAVAELLDGVDAGGDAGSR